MSKRSRLRRAGRDVKIITRSKYLPRLSPLTPIALPKPSILRTAQFNGIDNRRSHLRSSNYRGPVRHSTIHGDSAYVRKSFHKGKSLNVNLSFDDPILAAPCVRRRSRREVIFATGKGGRTLGTRRVRRSPSSGISC